MSILYHHRTRGQGAEGVHIMGIVDALRAKNVPVKLLSFPGADPEKAASSPEASGNASSGSDLNSPGLLARLLKQAAETTRHVPEFVFELIEIAYNILAVFRLLRETDSETEAIYERYSLFMFAGVLVAKMRGIPVILEINDSALVPRVRPLFFKRLSRWFERWIFSNATALVFISNYFRDIAKDNYPDMAPSVVLPNGADIEKFNPDHFNKDEIRARLGIEDKMVCGYVGAFVYWHGIDWFCKKIIPLISNYPNLVLLLVGDGVCYRDIADAVAQHGLEKQIILTGRVDHDKVPEYLAAMDYGVLPDSNEYGSPMKLFEFMAMGKGMVCPGFGPVKEVVTDGETGWLFEPGNQETCVQKVLDLSNDPDSLKKVGENARQYIIERRQWKHNAEKILELINQ